MPKVIAIVNDDRVRRQIESFLNEMETEDLHFRFFRDSQEFEELYFKAKKESRPEFVALRNKFPNVSQFSDGHLEWLVAQPKFNDKSPLSIESLKIQFSLQTLKAEVFDPPLDANAQIFQIGVEDFKSQVMPLTSFVPQVFQPQWKTFLETVKNSKSANLCLAMQIPGQPPSLIRIESTPTAGNRTTWTLSDWTNTASEDFDHERKRRASHTEETDELKIFSEVNLIIYKSDCVTGKPMEWLTQTRARLEKFGYWPVNGNVRAVLLKYEDEDYEKKEFQYPFLDDLIFLPLDRSLFLQKMEIIFNLPGTVSPSYLFNQVVEMDIEISKLTKIEMLSDVGMAIRNPVRLVPGLSGHFYFRFHGDKELLDLYGKVIRSEAHPTATNQFLVYFSFFGCRKKDLSIIRRALSKVPKYKIFKNDKREDFQYNPDNLFLSEEDKIVNEIAIIDSNESSLQNLSASVNKDMELVNVTTESSYSLFLHKNLRQSTTQNQPPTASDQNMFYAANIVLDINIENREMTKLHTPFQDTDLLLGHTAKDLFASPKTWWKIFDSEENIVLFEEASKLTQLGRRTTKIVVAYNEKQEPKGVTVLFTKSEQDNQARLTISPANADDIAKNIKQATRLNRLDLLIIDTGFLPQESFEGWLTGFSEAVKSSGLATTGKEPKIILISETEEKPKTEWLSQKNIVGYFPKPVDPKQLLFCISNVLNKNFTIYNFDNVNWYQPSLFVHVAKEAKLEALSEYGATIRHPRPIAPGSFLFLRGTLYNDAPGGTLCARFYACQEHESAKGEFECSLVYFGITEAYLKYARTWIREHYATSKQQG